MVDTDRSPSTSGNAGNYVWIAWLVLCSFLVWSALLLVLNLSPLQGHFRYWLGEQKPLFLEFYCWGALGGTLSAYLFLANDKDANEKEALKEKPDPAELRYPNSVDVGLYGMRMIFSGLQGMAGSLALYAGLIYFDVPTGESPIKRKVLFSLFSFLVGVNQKAFLTFLDKLTQRFLAPKEKRKTES
ncbi:MAG: hypothetical protein ACLQPN_22430 [Bryobacteraceae bacterium]